jgi:ABC-type protease/lipase transport system fused ATPase/permease subunit
LNEALRSDVQSALQTELPPPTGAYPEDVVVRYAGVKEPVLKGISLELNPGEAFGVIGPTGSGKSTLARLMIGAISRRAAACLDGVELSDWVTRESAHIGYRAQDIELLDGGGRIFRGMARNSPAIVEAEDRRRA